MSNSNRIFVSPGVYTSEKDLTFVAQSVGVTTLGLVGETLKGPAFEPILITDYDEFKAFFGGTSPLKDGNGNPKYELPYCAKSYLEESNQLFVTRILGLTGYKPSKTFGIQTIGGVVVDTDSVTESNGGTSGDTISNFTGSTYYNTLSGLTTYNGLSMEDYVVGNYSGFTGADDGKWFVIGKVSDASVTGLTSTIEQVSPLTGLVNSTNNNGKEWYNVSTNGSTEVYGYLFVYNSGTTQFDTTLFTYDSTLNSEYDSQTVASFRPRGSYTSQTLNLELTADANFGLSGTDVLTDPLGEFTISVTGLTSGAKSFTCSLDELSTKYITKVFGTEVFDRPKRDLPIYVNETYTNYLKWAYEQGYIRGLSLTEVYNDEGTNFMKEWDTPISPMVVSEVRGGETANLFEVITISDGDSANREVKISIININFDTKEFDVVVRDFNDTDDNMVALEKFSRCTMNPSLPGYIAKKIGTSDTEYELRSKYIMLRMTDNHPSDAIPSGFEGYNSYTSFGSTSRLGVVNYKTDYYEAGDVIGYTADGTPTLSGGEKIRKVMLGVSSTTGIDKDLLKYKGVVSAGVTEGFHLSTSASSITGSTPSGFKYKTTPYNFEDQSGDPETNKLLTVRNCKFTFAVYGGFDGWDIYREVRTYGDGFIYKKPTYVSGYTTNGGVFSTSTGNSDYYSFLTGINTFANPEAVDINIFATPGINFFDHSSLVSQAIDMVEEERADSLYIIGSPDRSTSDEVVDDLDSVEFDSNYSATYWPWVQVRDVDNATQLFIPPTGEVLRNIALTDNVSYPWFAVAGYSRGLVNSIKARKKLTLDERDVLYKYRINPIATFSDTGTIIWGNKTLQVRESALDRINVRRLLLRARKLISAVAVRLLFEQNDDVVRNEFLNLVNPILESIRRERGLTEFRVVVSNDPEDIDANTLRGKIYVKPTRSLEFIDVEFIITPTGASFENI